MSDWRMWARVVVGVVIAVIVFTVFMNIVGDYRSAKSAQKRVTSSESTTGPASSVTKTGRPPLNTPTTSGSKSGTKTLEASTTRVVLVVVAGVNLRDAPSTTANVVRALKKNERLSYYQTKNGYYEVSDRSGKRGWVSSNRAYTRLIAKQ